MGPSAPDPPGGWRPARVRFWESGRSRQTPVALELGRGWFPVELLAGELVTRDEPGAAVERRWRVADARGRVYILSPAAGGGWRVRPLRGAKV